MSSLMLLPSVSGISKSSCLMCYGFSRIIAVMFVKVVEMMISKLIINLLIRGLLIYININLEFLPLMSDIDNNQGLIPR